MCSGLKPAGGIASRGAAFTPLQRSNWKVRLLEFHVVTISQGEAA
jgi:hypothetical protein